jgi:hypothetical protein
MAAQASIFSKKQQNRRTDRPVPTAEQIRARAYEIYLQRGEQTGSEVEDWLQAEAELSLAGADVKPLQAKAT